MDYFLPSLEGFKWNLISRIGGSKFQKLTYPCLIKAQKSTKMKRNPTFAEMTNCGRVSQNLIMQKGAKYAKISSLKVIKTRIQ